MAVRTPIKPQGLLRSPRVVALALLAAAVLGVALILLAGGGGTYKTWASFEAVNGLVGDARVRVGGVDVGRVTNIDLGPDGYPRVDMKIDDDFRIRQGATAHARFFSVGGEANRVIDITQGDGPFLDPSAGFPRSRTDVPEEIDNVISLLDVPTRRDIHALFARLDQATTGRGQNIASALENSGPAFAETANVLGQVNDDGVALQRLVSQGRVTLAALNTHPGTAGGAIDRLGDLLSTTASQQSSLRATLAAAPASLTAADGAFGRLRRSVPSLRGFMTDARPAFRELAAEAPDLSATLAAAGPLLDQTDRLLGQSADVRRLGGLLRTALPTLKDLEPALTTSLPMMGELRSRFPDAFAFLSNWADFHATFDAAGNVGRVGLVFTPTPTNEISGNQAGPGEVKLPFLRAPGALTGEPWTTYRSTIIDPGTATP